MRDHFLKLFKYDYWANQAFLDCLERCTIVNNKIYLLFSHLVVAQKIWMCRIEDIPAPNEKIWEIQPVEKLSVMVKTYNQEWKDFIESCPEKEFSKEVDYINSKGESFSSNIQDILTHVINHSTHHRAQIASLMRNEHIDPPVTDYIQFARRKTEIY